MNIDYFLYWPLFLHFSILFRHLHRFDDELKTIDIVNNLPHRHGNQQSSRKDVIIAAIEKEREMFETSGFGNFICIVLTDIEPLYLVSIGYK